MTRMLWMRSGQRADKVPELFQALPLLGTPVSILYSEPHALWRPPDLVP